MESPGTGGLRFSAQGRGSHHPSVQDDGASARARERHLPGPRRSRPAHPTGHRRGRAGAFPGRDGRPDARIGRTGARSVVATRGDRPALRPREGRRSQSRHRDRHHQRCAGGTLPGHAGAREPRRPGRLPGSAVQAPTTRRSGPQAATSYPSPPVATGPSNSGATSSGNTPGGASSWSSSIPRTRPAPASARTASGISRGPPQTSVWSWSPTRSTRIWSSVRSPSSLCFP